jgi:antitoxin CptB
MSDSSLLDERGLSKLKWRCRRGLLENDLFIERFFLRYSQHLTTVQADALLILMDLPDNDLLDLFLGRVNPERPLNSADVVQVLHMIRSDHSPLYKSGTNHIGKT